MHFFSYGGVQLVIFLCWSSVGLCANKKGGRDMNSSDASNPLGEESIFKLIGKFAIPSMISLLVSAIYNITDQVFIGHQVGVLGNAATNVAFPVVTLATAISQLVGVGTAANFNICQGAKQEKEAKHFIGNGLLLMLFFGVGMMVGLLFFKTMILSLCGATDEVFNYANLYLSLTLFGIPFFVFFTAGSFLIRADGSPRYSMGCSITGALLNVGLDALFMLGFKWGIIGAALATVISQAISGMMCLRYFRNFKAFTIGGKDLRLQVRYVWEIIKLGFPNCLTHLLMMMVNVLMNHTLVFYGGRSLYGSEIPLAVSGVVAKLYTILSACSIGLAQGCQPIWGFNIGARNYGRVKETFKKAMGVALVLSCTAFFLFQFFPRQIVEIFGGGTDLYFQFATKYMRIYLMLICVVGVQPLIVNFFTSTKKMKQSMILSLARQGLFHIPLILLFPMWLGIDGVLYVGPIADFLTFMLSIILIMRYFKELNESEF